jgi:hypothetical protein
MRGLLAASVLLTLVACGGGGVRPASTTAPEPSAAAAGGAAVLAEAASPSLPLKLRVTAVRRVAGDVVRIELSVVNAAPPGAATPGPPAALALVAAMKALDGLSVLSGDGRRRVFALRTPDGERVGEAPQVPPPGQSRGFWAAFPLSAGPIRLAAPGFPVLTGLEVAPPAAPGTPEP